MPGKSRATLPFDTGLPRPGYAPRAVEAFRTLFGLEARACSTPRVVNSTYSGRVLCPRNVLAHLAEAEAQRRLPPELDLSFRTQSFPGVRARWTGLGTANVFRNGRYILVGVRSTRAAWDLHAALKGVITPRCWTTTAEASACAPAAVWC